MILPVNKSSKPDIENISFPSLQCWNPVTKVATIAAEMNGKRISCRVKINDLRKKFYIFRDEPMLTVTSHRTEIEKAARKLITNSDYEEDGSIMIHYSDL